MDLVFHLLAFVPVGAGAPPLARAASIHSESYQAFARSALPAGAVEPCARDASILAALFRREDVATGIQLLALLHDDVDELLAAALRGVGELGPGDVSSTWALSALQRLPPEPVEIARIALALAAPEFASAYSTVIEPLAEAMLAEIRPRLEDVGRSVAAVASADLRLSTTLGRHGRGFGPLVVVGAGAWPPSRIDPWAPIVMVVHELAVQEASRALERRGVAASWARSERLALLAAERVVGGTGVADAYAAWLAALGTDGLVAADAIAGDLITEVADALRGSPS